MSEETVSDEPAAPFVAGMRIPPQLRSRLPADRWPLTTPSVARLVGEGVRFTRPVTFLVGENGSGKSTLVEGLAGALKINATGGRLARAYSDPDELRTPLGGVLHLDVTADGARMLRTKSKKTGFFLRAETARQMVEQDRLGKKYRARAGDVLSMSHGQGYWAMFAAILNEPGVYLLDEPESGLSFEASLRLVALLSEVAGSGGQVICATHSPVLSAVPGAQILELGPHGVRETTWERLAVVDQWRRFLAVPDKYLRSLA
ncbi:MAG: AAA family ATPase [Segniliparus sp.]|uniref:AAA family ATPase n=1 Tax=Segniliparus sp. TaxID=2804064 RepID=UPI003F2B7305